MDVLKIVGGKPLQGKIKISGSKNSALPIMVASLLTEDSLVLSPIPNLADITIMANLLINHGASLCIDGSSPDKSKCGRTIMINAKHINNIEAPYEIVTKMRASILVLGPLLARMGVAKVSLPGGCLIGSRPVNFHLTALEKMGAQIELKDGYIYAKTNGRLKGAHIHFDTVTVGATQNILMAATLAEGITTITNAAIEPEITDLTNCLIAMGAKITGIGTNQLVIEGVKELHGAHHQVIADRIEAGSYAIAAAATGGEVELLGINESLIFNLTDKFIEAGIIVTPTKEGVLIKNPNKEIRPVDIMTNPYPGFPTDMQAQFMALMTIANGASIITENIFENRFMHVAELNRLGANISVNGNTAIVKGVNKLRGAQVMATDLRASVCLVIAGLVAEGETYINKVHHVDRGYEYLEEKLSACGANITRLKGNV